MDLVLSSDAIVGALMAAAVIGAAFASPLFRIVGLALAAALACVVYVEDGADGLSAMVQSLAAELAGNAEFAKGLAFGAVFTVVFALVAQFRRTA